MFGTLCFKKRSTMTHSYAIEKRKKFPCQVDNFPTIIFFVLIYYKFKNELVDKEK